MIFANHFETALSLILSNPASSDESIRFPPGYLIFFGRKGLLFPVCFKTGIDKL